MTPFTRGFIDGFTFGPLWRYIAKPYIEAERRACAAACDSIDIENIVGASEEYLAGRSMAVQRCARTIRKRSNA